MSRVNYKLKSHAWETFCFMHIFDVILSLATLPLQWKEESGHSLELSILFGALLKLALQQCFIHH